MTLGSVVRSCVFLSKCTQSKLTNATQMTRPRNVFLQFPNPRQHGNSDCRGKLQNKNLLVPCVRFTRVLPICRVANIDGAFTSYQSFLVNGSTLKIKLNFVCYWKHQRSIKCTYNVTLHDLTGVFYLTTCQLLRLQSIDGKLNKYAYGAQVEYWRRKSRSNHGVMSQCNFEVTIHIRYTITTLSNEQRLQSTTEPPCEYFTLDSKQIIKSSNVLLSNMRIPWYNLCKIISLNILHIYRIIQIIQA